MSPRQQAEVDLAKSLGFTCIEDPKRGAGWCQFIKGDWVVWECMYNGKPSWAVARVVDGAFCDHQYFTELSKALGSVK